MDHALVVGVVIYSSSTVTAWSKVLKLAKTPKWRAELSGKLSVRSAVCSYVGRGCLEAQCDVGQLHVPMAVERLQLTSSKYQTREI